MGSDDRESTESTEPVTGSTGAEAAPTGEAPGSSVAHRDLSEWRGREILDLEGERIGRLEDVYFDIETDQAQFGTVKEGFLDRHLTFVPLTNVTVGPDSLTTPVSKQQVKDAPNIELDGDELTQEGESALYHHYQLNYTPSETPSGRRLARR